MFLEVENDEKMLKARAMHSDAIGKKSEVGTAENILKSRTIYGAF